MKELCSSGDAAPTPKKGRRFSSPGRVKPKELREHKVPAFSTLPGL